MLTGLISFLGGSAFRLIFGEVSHWITAARDHRREIERMEAQERIDAAQHQRQLESMRQQKDLGVTLIRVQAEADLDRAEGAAWGGLVESTTHLTGILFLDIWNGCIRPLLATLAIVAVVQQARIHGWELTDWDRELIGAILGIYVADRQLAKRGK